VQCKLAVALPPVANPCGNRSRSTARVEEMWARFMAEARIQRRLAAILAADVAGYSRLMGSDEEGTLAAVKKYRRELIDPKLSEHRGRIVKTTGDGALVEFASAVDAIRCAIEIQRSMAERNKDVPEERRIEFRIGINVGDIISDNGDIYGDGVNIAARLESLAQPGAICLSDNAYRQIIGKLSLDVSDMGEQQLKNIAQPVRVYGLMPDNALCSALIMRGEHALKPSRIIAERLAELLPDGRLLVIDGAGHMGPFTHASKIAALIVRHIATIDAQSWKTKSRAAAPMEAVS
jgi:class 3 adenylate cyclase